MKIEQIDLSQFKYNTHLNGKWYCQESILDSETGELLTRYLQLDGTWARIANYFSSQEEIENTLKLGHKPDFTLSKEERNYIDLIQAWNEIDWEDQFTDLYEEYESDDFDDFDDFDDSYTDFPDIDDVDRLNSLCVLG